MGNTKSSMNSQDFKARIIGLGIFCNLVLIVTLFKAKRALDITTKLINSINSTALSAVLILSAVTLDLLYDWSGDRNHINYENLDQMFWEQDLDTTLKLSNDFQSLLVFSKKYKQSAISNSSFEDDGNISFVHSDQSNYKDQLKKSNFPRLRWWKTSTIEGEGPHPELIEVQSGDIEDREENLIGEKSLKPFETKINNLNEDIITYEENVPTGTKWRTDIHEMLSTQNNSVLIKNLAIPQANQNILHSYSRQLSKFKNSKSLLKFGTENVKVNQNFIDILNVNKG